jgi:uncharacterized protein YPO0396
MGKGISKGMIQMYRDILNKKYEPLISMLQAKSKALAPRVALQVKKDMGVYALMMEEAALKKRLEEVESELRRLNAKTYNYQTNRYDLAAVDVEIDRRLTEMNEPLMQVNAAKEAADEKIMLMGAGDDVAKVFENIAAEVTLMMDKFKDVVLPGTEALAQIEMNEEDFDAAIRDINRHSKR